MQPARPFSPHLFFFSRPSSMIQLSTKQTRLAQPDSALPCYSLFSRAYTLNLVDQVPCDHKSRPSMLCSPLELSLLSFSFESALNIGPVPLLWPILLDSMLSAYILHHRPVLLFGPRPKLFRLFRPCPTRPGPKTCPGRVWICRSRLGVAVILGVCTLTYSHRINKT